MTKPIAIGDEFEIKSRDGKHVRVNRYRREADDLEPTFECERIRVTHLSCSDAPGMEPYTFGAEPEWFRQRGLEAA